MSLADPRASRTRRLFATLIDLVVVTGVAFLAIWPLGIFEHESAYEPFQVLLRICSLLIGSYLLVNIWLLYSYSQTVGKRLLGIRIVDASVGRPLPLWRLLLRASWVVIALIAPILLLLALVNVLFIFLGPRRCLHDYIVGSRVTTLLRE